MGLQKDNLASYSQDCVVKLTVLDYNLINYCYMSVLLFLLIFNIVGYITAQIAYREEARRQTQKLVFPASSDFGETPYTNLDVNGPGGEQLWSVKL